MNEIPSPYQRPSADVGLIAAAGLISFALHLLLLINPFVSGPAGASKPSASELKVTLQRSERPQPPRAPVAVSQQDNDSAGNEPPPTAPAVQQDRPPRPPEPLRRQVLTREADTNAPPRPSLQPPVPVQDSSSLLAQARQIAANTGPLSENRPDTPPARTGVYGVSAVGVPWARYVEDWRLKIERIGNLNYPSEARSQGITGSLVLVVVLQADGKLAGLRVKKSSGQPVLDAAAQNIVRMSSPFAPFPPELAAQYDTLEIVRKWSFNSDNQLTSH